jgi:hypothetical protein
MCNLYSITKGPQAIREFARAMRDKTGNLPPIPGVFPDYFAPVVRNESDAARELTMARWGMPSPQFAIDGRKTDPGVTNIRNVASLHWRRWLGVESRCVVPFTSFFAAFLGLAPKQNSSGGKQRLGRISKMGNWNLRKLLVVGALAVLFHRKPHTYPLRMSEPALTGSIVVTGLPSGPVLVTDEGNMPKYANSSSRPVRKSRVTALTLRARGAPSTSSRGRVVNSTM